MKINLIVIVRREFSSRENISRQKEEVDEKKRQIDGKAADIKRWFPMKGWRRGWEKECERESFLKISIIKRETFYETVIRVTSSYEVCESFQKALTPASLS